jgi:hypothetical protein
MNMYHEIMNGYKGSSKTPVVREPVQVYLDAPDRDRLERLTSRLEATKSDVLRRGLQALEHELSDPNQHPALRIVGILNTAGSAAQDGARDHDHILADAEEESWSRGEEGG